MGFRIRLGDLKRYLPEADETVVYVPENVESISGAAFSDSEECQNITKIVVPDSVKSIDARAFARCKNLKELYLGSGVSDIGYERKGFKYKSNIVDINASVNIEISAANPVFHSDNNCIVETKKKVLVFGTNSGYIPDDGSVSRIGESAFSHCTQLEYVKLPDCIKYIDKEAFLYCQSISRISIPESVKKIGADAFDNCSSLTEITIPESVQEIGADAFYNCSSLTEITIPDNVKKLGSGAFACCKNLENVTVGEGITQLPESVFGGCTNLKQVKLGKNITKINKSAFNGDTNLSCIWIPPVDNIDDILKDCPNICEIICPEKSYSSFSSEYKAPAIIGYLKNMQLYSDEKIVDEYKKQMAKLSPRVFELIFKNDLYEVLPVLADNKKITATNYDKKFLSPAQEAKAEKCVAFLKDWQSKNVSSERLSEIKEKNDAKENSPLALMKKLWSYRKNDESSVCLTNYKGEDTEIIVPEVIGNYTVTSLKKTFYKKRQIKSVTVPKTVKEIGEETFFECDSLREVVLNQGLEIIGSYAFYRCEELEKIDIPDTVKEIGESAWKYCEKMTEIKLPDGLTCLEDSLFSRCGNLKTVSVPDSVSEIGDSVFWMCSQLAEFKFPNGVTKIGSVAFDGCRNLKEITIPTSVKTIDNSAFSGCSGIKNITIPEGVTEICSGVFADCRNLKEIIIPTSVKTIDNSAFSGCSGIKNITIPEGVTKIGDKAFASCYKLASISLPDSLTSIGEEAFEGCYNLTSITIPKNVNYVGGGFIADCSGIETVIIDKENKRFTVSGNCVIDISEKKLVAGFGNIVIPSDGSVESIEKNAFTGCRSLVSVVLPNSVKNIGKMAFSSCYNLKEVYLPESLSSICDDVFYGCTLLKCNDFSSEIEALIAEKRRYSYGDVVAINYDGTKAQWQAVRKYSVYSYGSAAAIVAKCKDGEAV